MYLTKKQFSFTIIPFLIALTFGIAEFSYSYYKQIVLETFLYDGGFPLYFTVKFGIETVLFWGFVLFFTKDAKSCLSALILQLCIGYVHYLIDYLFPEVKIFGITGVQLIDFLIRSLPYLLFGFLHFKNNRWWLFLLFHFALTALYMSNGNQIEMFLTQYTDYDAQRLFMIEATFKDGSSSNIVPIQNLVKNLTLVWQYLLFFCCYNLIKTGFTKQKLQLVDIVNQKYDSLNFTVILWSSGLILFAATLALTNVIFDPQGFYSLLMIVINSIAIAILIFALVSFYRNMVTVYMLNKGVKVGWNYVFLSAPILGFFIWLYLILRKRQPISDANYKTYALTKFTQANKNIILKGCILAINCLALVLFLLLFGKESLKNIVPVIIALAAGVAAISVHYIGKNAVFVLFGIFALGLIIYPFAPLPLLSISLTSAMISLLKWMPVFQLDQMNFVSAKPFEEEN